MEDREDAESGLSCAPRTQNVFRRSCRQRAHRRNVSFDLLQKAHDKVAQVDPRFTEAGKCQT